MDYTASMLHLFSIFMFSYGFILNPAVKVKVKLV